MLLNLIRRLNENGWYAVKFNSTLNETVDTLLNLIRR